MNDDYVKAKRLLSCSECRFISNAQYHSMQKRILDLGNEINSFYKIAENGLSLMHSINEAITYNNMPDAQKGIFALPKKVIDEMNEFTQSLHDIHDQSLPLIKD